MPEVVVTAGRILHELDGASVLSSSKGSTDLSSLAFVETNVHRGKTSSVLSRTSVEGIGMIGLTHATPPAPPEGILTRP
ncbi:hypothetical protein BJV78DRAFT_1209011, partial [Lactifluus subvellereus]